MATKTGANLLDSILQSTGVTLNALLTATLTAKLQQMIDDGTDSNLAVSIAVSGFSTDINAATDVSYLTDTIAANVALIEAAEEDEVLDFPLYEGPLEPQSFTLTSDADEINEGSTLTFTVTATNPVTEDTVVTFDVIPTILGDLDDAGTTGTNLDDFTSGSLTGTATIAAGDTTATFTVIPSADLITELSENFSVKATVNGEELMADATVLDGAAAAVESPLVLTPSDDGSTMRLTGDQDVRIDFTDTTNQITGLDLDFDGTIEADGVENAVDVMPTAGYTIVDAYARNPLNHNDSTNNFLGDIAFDGTGFDGDGVSTNGNIFLGGLGADSAAGGIGNDFMVGGGVADPTTGEDYLFGGRNADFFFTSLSALDFTDGDSLDIDGGETADDTAAGTTESGQDTDWLLFEASDDDEPVFINLGSATEAGTIRTEFQEDDGGNIDEGDANDGIDIINLENVDASGNLYGFLDDVDVAIGENGMVVDGENVGIGATAQLQISGNGSVNRIIGGFDNDWIDGQGGDDLLMGGNLDYNNNPNTQNIVNDGTDELIGGQGNDHLVFELDNGVYEAGSVIDVDDAGNEGLETDDSGKALDQIVQDVNYDTLWLTDNLAGTSTVDEMTTDNTVRLDLAVGKVGGLANSSGYGGADENFIDAADIAHYTADQTNYANEGDRTQVQDIENVNATGLGDVDYVAAGTNDPELTFNNQQNLEGLEGADLDLRGTYRTLTEDGNNHLYAGDGQDNLEGRTGDDKLMGGEGDDDFIFDLGYVDAVAGTDGDGENVIHRLDDTDGDNIWDGTYSRDFLLGGSTEVESSDLNIQITNNDDTLEVGIISFYLEGEQFVINGGDLANQPDMGSIVDYVNDQLPVLLADSGLTGIESVEASLAAGTDTGDTEGSFTITANADADATEAPRFTEAGDTFDPDSVQVFINTSDSDAGSTASENPGGIEESGDRLIFAAYEDRADGELVDDDAFVDDTGDAVTLGADGYAEDLVVRFTDDDTPSTILAEDQNYDIDFVNLADEDAVTITINGVQFSAQMGVSPSGTDLDETMGQFLNRFANEINAAMDNDTKAGQVNAVSDGVDTLTFTQVAYNGGETVFMDTPEVEITNGSGGEGADYWIWDNTDTEVDLFEFDGRDGALDAGSVLFLGGAGMDQGEVTDASMSRSVLATAVEAGETLEGSDAIVVDSIADTDSDAVDFSLHGDDYLIGGGGNDILRGGTGDDRFQGSEGSDEIDGGKDHYVVTTLEAGEQVETVLELNAYEANDDASIVAAMSAQASKEITAGQIVDAEFIDEDGFGLNNGDGYQDTLVYNQNDFSDDAQFTITLDGDIEQQNGGEGTVQVDEGGNGSFEYTSTFTEMEAVRTLSGNGTHAGQGNDTLDVAAVSNAVAATEAGDPDAAVIYNMTSDLGVVQINADLNDDDEIDDDNNVNGPDENDAFMAVDGVERFIGGDANEQLNIDESEAKKDNYFDGADEVTLEDDDDDDTTDDPDLDGDSIVYDHTDMDNNGVADDDGNIDNDANGLIEDIDFDDPIAVSMRPSIEIVVESDSETDLVNMTGGSVIGADVTTDTLVDVETIDVSNAALSAELDDTIVMAGYADYADGEVRESEDGDVLVQITGMTEIENIQGSDDDDGVQVADAAAMGTNYRAFNSDDATTAISYASFLDYANEIGAVQADGFTADGDFEDTDDDGFADTRVAFASQDADDRAEANNQALFTFDLADGRDRVDYSNDTSGIAAVVDLEDAEVAQTVFVDGDGDATFDQLGDDDADRIDLLKGVEEVVASQGESILDFTGSDTNLEINYQSSVDATMIASKDLREHVIDIQDLDTSVPFGDFTYIEYMDADEDDDIAPNPEALWNRIEGSDNNEKIELTDDQSGTVHTFNLRGGANEVNYNELTKGIELSVDSLEDGITALNIQAKNTAGAILNAGDTNNNGIVDGAENWTQYDRITSYNGQNDVAVGSLRIEASQSENDSINFSSLTDNNLVVLGQTEGAADILTVSFAVGTEEEVNLTLTGFESLIDGAGDDIYVIEDLEDFFDTLALVDNPAADSDTLRLTDGALDSDGGVTWDDDSIELDDFEAEIDAQNGALGGEMDFDTLDISQLTETTDYVVTNDANETLVLGDLGNFGDQTDADIDVQGFATIQFNSADGMGSDVVIDMDEGEFRQSDGTVLFTFDSATTFDFSAIDDDMEVDTVDTAGVDLTISSGGGDDEITGGAGNDVIAGGAGDDTLNGGGNEVLNTFTVELNGLATAAGNATILGQTVAVAVNDGPDIVGAQFAAINAEDFDAGVTAAPVAVSYDTASNQLTFSFDYDASAEFTGIDVASTAAGFGVANPSEESAYALPGAGNDTIYGGPGVDVIDGGDGDDIFVVVGEVDNSDDDDINDDYNTGDTAGTAAAEFEAAVEAIEGEDGQDDSDVSTDTFDGGDGNDTIEIWGDVDFTDATITDIEVINMHSTAKFNIDQLEGVTINVFDADSVVIIEDEFGDETIFGGDDDDALDLSGLQDFVDAIGGDDGGDTGDDDTGDDDTGDDDTGDDDTGDDDTGDDDTGDDDTGDDDTGDDDTSGETQTVDISAADDGTTLDADGDVTTENDDVTFDFSDMTSDYSLTIENFGDNDVLDFADINGAEAATINVIQDADQADGVQVLEVANMTNTVEITLIGLTGVQDSAIFNTSSFEDAFAGANLIV